MWIKKKKRLEANAIPSHTTPGRGKNSSGQERRKVRRKEKWWKWAEISREERQGLEGGCVTDSFRTILFYIIVNCSYFIFFFIFFVCELFIINFFFFCCLTCVDFFFCYPLFLFVCLFFCYTCLVFLLVLGDWAYRVICFVVYCYLFILFFLFIFILFIYLFIYFFYLHGFSGFIFCEFNCSWHSFTSSDRVSPGGGGAREPRFADWYRGVVSYTNDDLGKRVAWLT